MKASIILNVIIANIFLFSSNANAQIINKLKEKVNRLSNGHVDRAIESFNDKTSVKTNQNNTNNSTLSSKIKYGGAISGNLSSDKRIIFKAPNDDFVDFELLSHKGLPRFGVLPTESDISARRELQRFYEIYSSLIELKYSKDRFDMEQLKRDNLGTYSPYTINGIKRLTYLASNDNSFPRYFCHNEVDCKIPELKFFGNNDNGSVGNFHWGGRGATQFQQRRIFNSFLEKDYGVLAEWSKKIWEKDHEMAYLVTIVKSTNIPYNFHRQGYSLAAGLKTLASHNLKNDTFYQLQIYSIYTPHHPFEKNEATVKHNVFFQIKPEEAENLVKANITDFYAVYKIRISFHDYKEFRIKGFKSPFKQVFKYNVESPVVEVFSDKELTNKIGEFSLETASI